MSSADNQQEVLTTLEIPNLKKIASGKVREIFELPDASQLLFVATDRISAYDVIMANGVPQKGALLTQMSQYWFDLIREELPALKIHLLSTDVPAAVTDPADRARLRGRTMVVRRTPVVKLESIVRGYLTGSAWAEYRAKGTVHGMPVPAGLRESQRFDTPLWTPSTKADAGEHDENITRAQAADLVGPDVADRIEQMSLRIYEIAHAHALARGIIIADTKLEFGWDAGAEELVLVDEVLTPDSSRFWPRDDHAVGAAPASYDKQFLRDWLTANGLKGLPGVAMPADVVRETAAKYREAFAKITGQTWGQA